MFFSNRFFLIMRFFIFLMQKNGVQKGIPQRSLLPKKNCVKNEKNRELSLTSFFLYVIMNIYNPKLCLFQSFLTHGHRKSTKILHREREKK